LRHVLTSTRPPGLTDTGCATPFSSAIWDLTSFGNHSSYVYHSPYNLTDIRSGRPFQVGGGLCIFPVSSGVPSHRSDPSMTTISYHPRIHQLIQCLVKFSEKGSTNPRPWAVSSNRQKFPSHERITWIIRSRGQKLSCAILFDQSSCRRPVFASIAGTRFREEPSFNWSRVRADDARTKGSEAKPFESNSHLRGWKRDHTSPKALVATTQQLSTHGYY
jgi:hypothetical protein